MIEKDYANKIKEWQVSPLTFIRDFFPEIELSTQQKQAFVKLGELIIHRLTVKDAIYIGLSIQSGKGTGKDFFLALAVLWFLFCFKDCRIPMTAPTANLLQSVLMAEINKVKNLSIKDKHTGKSIFDLYFHFQQYKIVRRGNPSWYAIPLSVKPTKDISAIPLQGRHEKFTCACIDEAAGVPNANCRALEGSTTQDCNIIIVIFNPNKATGYALETQDDKRFFSMRWNAEESDIVSHSHIKQLLEKYGRDSNTYRIDVLGLPPKSGDNILIPHDWIEEAIDREVTIIDTDLCIMSLDPGAGSDKSVIITRIGDKVIDIQFKSTPNSLDLEQWVLFNFNREIIYEQFGKKMKFKHDYLLIDGIGLGSPIADSLEAEIKMRLVRVIASNKSVYPDRYLNLRAEMYWNLRTVFQKGRISIPKHIDLIHELDAITVSYDTGRTKIGAKLDIKKEIGCSPDFADALAISYAKELLNNKRPQTNAFEKAGVGGTWMGS